MNRSTWLLALLALLATFGVGRLIDRARTQRPRELLASAEARLEAVPPDFERALYELNLALDQLGPGEDLELERQLLEARAGTQERRGIRQAAMRDFRRLLEMQPENEEQLRQRLARLQLDERQHEGLSQTLEPILQKTPWHSGVKLLLGLSAMRRGSELEQPLLSSLSLALPPRLFKQAEAIARRARSVDSSAPERGALLAQFKAVLEPELGSLTADRVAELERIGEHVAEARGLFTEALLGYAHAEAAWMLGNIFFDAGRAELAAELLLAANAQPQVRSSLPAQQVLARALRRMGRPQSANQIIDRSFPAQLNENLVSEFLPEWGQILYESKDWRRLQVIARRIGVIYAFQPAAQRQRDAGNFYAGVAYHALERYAEAATALSAFARPEAQEPHPGALTEAYRTLADVYRQQGVFGAELENLQSALDLDGDRWPEAWMRVADLFHERPSEQRSSLTALARALSLDPGLEASQLERFETWGRAHLTSSGIDPELLRELLARQGRAFPADSDDVYLLMALARLNLQQRQSHATHLCLDQIETLVPAFGPALDLRAEQYRLEGLEPRRIEVLLRRVARPGHPEAAMQALREARAAGRLDQRQRLTLLELDGAVTGVLTFARQALDRGRADLALRGLQPALTAAPAALGSEGLCLAAEAELNLGRAALVEARLASIGPEDPLAVRALGLRLAAALDLEQADLLLPLIDSSVEKGRVDQAGAIELVDDLLERGLLVPARRLLDNLDADPRTRSADTTLRLALAALLAGQGGASAEAWDRSEAWFEDGTPALGRVLLAIQTAGWRSLPERVREARSELPEGESFTAAILAVLEERLDEALALAEAGEREAPAEPLWTLLRLCVQSLRAEPLTPPPSFGADARPETQALLRGGGELRRDPRQALLALLCLERPVFQFLARDLLRRTGPDAALWSGFLEARRLLARGERRQALEKAFALTLSFPDFGPAWDLAERLLAEELEQVDHPELLALQARRAARSPLDPATEGPRSAAELISAALARSNAGAADEALAWCQRAIQRFPEDPSARWFYAQRLAAAGSYEAALNQATAFAELASAQALGWHLTELLELFWQAHSRGALSAAGLLVELDALALRLPQDPLVALAQARYELLTHPENRRIGVERAWNRLEKFRAASGDVPLDSLRNGATQAWLGLYETYAPELGERLIRAELAQRPEDLDLWLMLGRCYEAQNDPTRALEYYEALRRMLPDTRAIARICELLAKLGTDHARLERELSQLSALDRLPPEAPRPRFLRGKSLVVGRQGVAAEGLELLSGLWDQRQQIASVVAGADLGLVYGSALLRRGDREDRERIRSVFESSLELEQDALRRDLLQALLNLSRWLDNG
jgi:hypothetical protein